jgi:hypothetical protein
MCVIEKAPSWIQAICACGLLVLTYLTLMVLRDYAAENETIAHVAAFGFDSSRFRFYSAVDSAQELWQRSFPVVRD